MWDDFDFTGAKYRQFLADMQEIEELESLIATGDAPPESEKVVLELYARWID